MERTWEIMHIFQTPVNGQNIKFQEVNLIQPVGVRELIRINWDQQLVTKQSQLTAQGIKNLAIQPYLKDKSPNPLNALYEEGEAKMWPGPAITLVNIQENSSVIELDVAQTYFPFIAALNDPQIKQLYIDQGIEIPRPSLGICTFAETLDGKLVLTVRGQRTNMYPGRLYGQGGNPLFTTVTPVENQVAEMSEEILVTHKTMIPDKWNLAD